MASSAAARPPGAVAADDGDEGGCLLDALAAAVPASQARSQEREPLAECSRGGINNSVVGGDGLPTNKARPTNPPLPPPPPPPPHPLLRYYLSACADEGLPPDDRISRELEAVPLRLCLRRGATSRVSISSSLGAVAAGRLNFLPPSLSQPRPNAHSLSFSLSLFLSHTYTKQAPPAPQRTSEPSSPSPKRPTRNSCLPPSGPSLPAPSTTAARSAAAAGILPPPPPRRPHTSRSSPSTSPTAPRSRATRSPCSRGAQTTPGRTAGPSPPCLWPAAASSAAAAAATRLPRRRRR